MKTEIVCMAKGLIDTAEIIRVDKKPYEELITITINDQK